MELKYLVMTVDAGVATVLINRPDKRNALSPEVLTEIAGTFEELSSREDVRVVVFTGGEKYFSAGFDLEFIRTVDRNKNEEFIALFRRAYHAVKFCAVPVIAAVGGAAIAGGFDLTQMCDLRYASTRARFSQREVMLSLLPILDPLWRIIGLTNAMDWALTARIVDAEEAHRVGFVIKIFPEGALVKEVGAIAAEMAKCDRACLAETKRMTLDILTMTLEQSMQHHGVLFRSYVGCDDNRKRVDAMLETIRSDRKK
ncbi:MAG: enoyl-CoA hydratase/isomerase family protein [Spirochaetes bacterium]|nr:enoyl-CoA hydratase/isomerase family protein [Spirochaetota bacterium]